MNAIMKPEPMHGLAAATSDSNKAIAEIQSAMAIAKRFPRNEVQAIDKITNAFQRQSLAAVSQYQYAKGGSDVIGPSIRSAEAIAQLWGNIQFGFRELSRGVDENGVTYSEVEAYAWDIESNTKRPTTFIVKHWRDTRQGGYQLKDEREIYELTANMAQRRVRACIMAVIPGDVFDVAMNQAESTLKSNADTSPEAMQKLVDTFSKEFGVSKDQIEARIQRRLDAIRPAQVIQLKRIYVSLRDGMSAAADWFDAKPETEETLPEMTDEKFKAESGKWKKTVSDGKKTAEQLIATLSTKYQFTEDQINQIKSWEASNNGSA